MPLHMDDCDCDGCCPSPSAHLDPLETPWGRVRHPLVPPAPSETRALVETFRHGFWRGRRLATRAALSAIEAPAGTIERFEGCGQNCWVLAGQDKAQGNREVYRLACDRCHNRWCEACSVERRRTICRNLGKALQERQRGDTAATTTDRIRFVTLTLKHTDSPLKDQISKLLTSFAKLRQRRSIADKISGGLAFLEIKKSKRDGMWHPHLHCLIEGDYIPKEVLAREWLAVTTDSFIVDIRKIRSVGEAIGYVAKYAAKAIDSGVWQHAPSLQEAMIALAGRRTFNAFGSWRSLSLSRPSADAIDWEPLCSLRVLIYKTKNGDAEARRILMSLSNGAQHEPLDGLVQPARASPMPDLS